MWGICGVFNAWSGEPASSDLVARMTGLIAHRGPDDSGVYLDGPAGLGFARLSIIDLDGGHQPMANETGDVWTVFNGRLKDEILSARTRASIDDDGSRAFRRWLAGNPQRDDLSSMIVRSWRGRRCRWRLFSSRRPGGPAARALAAS